MAKSRTVRAREKKLERLRKFICCVKSPVQDEIIDEIIEDIDVDKTEIVCDGKSLSPRYHDQNPCMTLPENPIPKPCRDHVKRDNSLELDQRPLSEKILDEIIMNIIAKSDVKNIQSPLRRHINDTTRHEERESNEQFARQILNTIIEATVGHNGINQKKPTRSASEKRTYPPVPKKNDQDLPNKSNQENTEMVEETINKRMGGKPRSCKNREQNGRMTLPENPKSQTFVKRDNSPQLDEKPLSERVLDEIIMKILVKSDGKRRQNFQLPQISHVSPNTTQKNNEEGESNEEIAGQILNAIIEDKPLSCKNCDRNLCMTLPENPKTQSFVRRDNSLELDQRTISERILDEIRMEVLAKPDGKNRQNLRMLPKPNSTVNTTQKNNEKGESNEEIAGQSLNTIIGAAVGHKVNTQKKPPRPPAPKRNDPHQPKRNDPPIQKRNNLPAPKRYDQGLPNNTKQENTEMVKEIINGIIDASVGHNGINHKKPPRPPAPRRNYPPAPKRNNLLATKRNDPSAPKRNDPSLTKRNDQGLPHNVNQENTEMIKDIINGMIGEICSQPTKTPPPRPSFPVIGDLCIIQRSTTSKRQQEEFIKQVIDDIILNVTCTTERPLTLMRSLSLMEIGISNKERPAQPKCPLSKRQRTSPNSNKPHQIYPLPPLEQASINVHKLKPPRPPAIGPPAPTRPPMPNAQQWQIKPLRPATSTRQLRPKEPQKSIKPPRPIERQRQQETYKANKPPRLEIPLRPKGSQKTAIPSRPQLPPRQKESQKQAIPMRPQLPPRPKESQEPFRSSRPSKTPGQKETHKPNKPPMPEKTPRPKEVRKPAIPPRPQLLSRLKGPNIPSGLKRTHREVSEKCNIKENTPQINKFQTYYAFRSPDDYPAKLNPFAEDADEDQSSDDETESSYETADSEIDADDEALAVDDYPNEFNPFADTVKLEDPEVKDSCETTTTDDYPEELNPFAADDDD